MEEIKSSEPSQLPIPNLNLPGFPAGLMQNLPQNLPNFDPSNLPQGVREFAMLQQQQLAQVWNAYAFSGFLLLTHIFLTIY